MQKDGVAVLGNNNVISGLKPNSTESYSITLAGEIGVDGHCKGIPYSDPYGSWTDVVVQGVATISLRSSYVPVHINTGKIHLKSGTICTLSDGHCVDSEHGYTYWQPMPTSSCDFHQYDILYEGQAIKIQEDSINQRGDIPIVNPSTVYSLTTQDITFALTTTKARQLCGYTILQTEHPKLLEYEGCSERDILG
ncbi:hypothetical protein EAI_10469 [Harpegnathos saltator]|uniref:Uncharacterized protein n=1 Tax=Harpegnathos saltator TaxID=610380 RepID=E2BS31_HARSA|nr:hypothetical protein EAI_10469 [Harpegnathos saltator]